MLNRELFVRLKEVFGKVTVHNEDEPLQSKYAYDIQHGKTKITFAHWGETFSVNCPFCHLLFKVRPDTRERLWISHRWCTPVLGDIKNSYRLAICFNEYCLSYPEIRKALQRLVWRGNPITCRPSLSSMSAPRDYPQTLPSGLILLNLLPEDHPAIRFIRDIRGFDPYFLAENFSVCYCVPELTDVPAAAGRLIIPVFNDGQLYGWQARSIDGSPPKYLANRHSNIHKTFYGLDLLKSDEAILVEGPFDCWRVGPGALGLFGSSLSATQLDILKKRVNRVIIMLDGDATEKAKRIADKLSFMPTRIITLPDNKDPADFSREELMKEIANVF